MQLERGATLTPAINAPVWEQGVATRLVLFRDWLMVDNELRDVRLVGVQKCNGQVSPDGMGLVVPFRINRVCCSPALRLIVVFIVINRIVLPGKSWQPINHPWHQRQTPIVTNGNSTISISKLPTAKGRIMGGRTMMKLRCQACHRSGRAVKISFSVVSTKMTTRLVTPQKPRTYTQLTSLRSQPPLMNTKAIITRFPPPL
jgi:hypothetical protein